VTLSCGAIIEKLIVSQFIKTWSYSLMEPQNLLRRFIDGAIMTLDKAVELSLFGSSLLSFMFENSSSYRERQITPVLCPVQPFEDIY
jgi:hypothetical protein